MSCDGVHGVCSSCPKVEWLLTNIGEMLATAGDDGNVLLWVPADTHTAHNFEEGLEDKETWRVRTMCRSIGSEIYDLAWSPDGVFFITGSMDNIARIYNAQTGISPSSTSHPTSYSTSSRKHRTANCRAQPLRPRRGLGPLERVHRNPVV
jgi:WD40 repeat protein